MKRLTNKEFQERLDKNTNDSYLLISQYVNKNTPVQLLCKKHNTTFTAMPNWYMRGPNDIRGVGCPQCKTQNKNEQYKNNRITYTCAYCGKPITKKASHKSKSNLYFCSRECKDKAQKITSGPKFSKLRPSFYGTIISDYRKLAFSIQPHECHICKWSEDINVLEVHHIDENRNNNNPNNLLILCPICHRKLTSKKYELTNDHNRIIPIQRRPHV